MTASARTILHKASFQTVDYRVAALFEAALAGVIASVSALRISAGWAQYLRSAVLTASCVLSLYAVSTRLDLWLRYGELTSPTMTGWLREHRATAEDRAKYALAELRASAADAVLRGEFNSATKSLWLDPTWPVPSRVRLRAAVTDHGSLRLTADAGRVSCQAYVGSNAHDVPRHDDLPQDAVTCRNTAGDAIERVTRAELQIVRDPRPTLYPVVAADTSAVWPQYRFDAARTGHVEHIHNDATTWRANIAGPIRGGISIVGEIVLAATHGSGLVSAFDRSSGRRLWVTREPSWVHQEPVSDGRRVAIGFGDNLESVVGYAPSGVAVHDLRSGQRLWTRFTVGSVMNSPVLAHGLVVVTTSARELIAFDATDGEVKWSATMPGLSIMGPPAVRGDTVFVGLDPNVICSFGIQGSKYWCVRVPNAAMLGHSAVSIIGKLVLATSTTDKDWWTTLESWSPLGARGLRQWLAGTAVPPVVRQELLLISITDGSLLGRIALGDGAPPEGHSSGTAVPLSDDRFVAVVVPATRQLAVVDLAQRREVWAVDLGADARGPPSILEGDTALVISRIGVAHIYDLRGEREVCASHLRERFDRAGAAVSGDLAVVGTEGGGVRGILTTELLRCFTPSNSSLRRSTHDDAENPSRVR